MRQTLAAFFIVFVLTALLAAFCFAVSLKGYPHGATGIARLDSIANAATFIPLAALYAFAGLLIVLSPARAAGFLYANAASPIYFSSCVASRGHEIVNSSLGMRASPEAAYIWSPLACRSLVPAKA